jgi:hypothetical protein
MKERNLPRKPVVLSEPTQRLLGMYALTASAAGVGMLALAQPADAKIVYRPAHVVVGRPVPLDLNRDGIVDFTLINTYATGKDLHALIVCQTATETAYKGYAVCHGFTNMVRAKRDRSKRFLKVASALPPGAKIQAGDRFAKAYWVEMGHFFAGCCGTDTWYGPWMNDGKGVKDHYVGLKFNIKGRFHFGWARLTVGTSQTNFTAVLTGYAYETIPNKPIIAGKTKGPDVITPQPDRGTLGRLALGRK